jgi:lipoprotein-anchoring transpeptidase ErfK/SrfK
MRTERSGQTQSFVLNHCFKNSVLYPALLVFTVISCAETEPPGANKSDGRNGTPAPVVSSSAATVASNKVEPSVVPVASVTTSELPPHPGPWLKVLSPSVAIYSAPNIDRSSKLGYAQNGARIPVTGKATPGEKCNAGWLEVVGGGFVCSASGTLDEKEGRAKFTIRRPDLEQVLPYTYARNAKNGTPLYRTIPTKEQMLEYEPYLKKSKEEKTTESNNAKSEETAATTATNTTSDNGQAAGSAAFAASKSAGTSVVSGVAANNGSSEGTSDAGATAGNEASESDRPWWQREGIDDKLHKLRLTDLHEGSDGVLALRMVRGFYIAVDKTFSWNGRTWYKSTKGLVAPADRMTQAAASDFHGVELGAEYRLPIGWVYGGRDKVQLYEIDKEKKRVKVSGTVEKFVAVKLVDETQEIGGVIYRGTADGKWVRQAQMRITEPGKPPTELREGERWVDVDLSSQTLIVFEGSTPLYATLISSGKSSRNKDKDHATPIGQWRIREKHITATMDGDGTDAGDNPYSIEDVPFVMYFHKSYAIHGAFWHRNFGAQMSHGCINLAPLDAKAVFMKTAPYLPTEWHGAWSSETKPGSWVVVHE